MGQKLVSKVKNCRNFCLKGQNLVVKVKNG